MDEPAENGDDTLFQAIDGVMQTLEVLVMCLGKAGQMDTAEYARLLTDWRSQHVGPGSMQEAVIDRMLGLLVDRPDVLVRRAAIRLAAAEGPGGAPTAASSRPGPETGGESSQN